MRHLPLFLVGLAYLSCASDGALPGDSQSETETQCGSYAFRNAESDCECTVGYEWCESQSQGEWNCCAIDSFCGSGICDPGESTSVCPQDCEEGVTCGDGDCSPTEAQTTCPADCGAPSSCGDGDCAIDENERSCPADCDPEARTDCGDGICEVGETSTNCPGDCREDLEPSCGNGECESGESASSCPADCSSVEEPTCGDGVCEFGESHSSCSADCAASACTQFECLEELCITDCDNWDLCGAHDSPDDLSQCYSQCLEIDTVLAEWLDPRLKETDCISAMAALASCTSTSTCEELADVSTCAVENSTFERECALIPYYVDVTFLAALMGPHSPDGCQWDGPFCSPVSEQTLNELGELIATAALASFGAPTAFVPARLESALGEIVGAVMGTLLSGTAPPDIFGDVTVTDADLYSAPTTSGFGVTDNSYTVDLGPTTFRGVLLDERVLATLSLYDEDTTIDDPVGPVNLDRRDLISAWLTGGNAWVLVADSASDQVLQVQLRVMPYSE